MFVKKIVICFTTLKTVDPLNHPLSINCALLICPIRKLTADGKKG